MEQNNNTHRSTHRDPETRQKLVNRLARIEGQIRGIRSMVENDAYCSDVLTQASAAAAAINSFNRELLAEHIRGCVTRDIRNGDTDTVDELLQTLAKLMK